MIIVQLLHEFILIKVQWQTKLLFTESVCEM